MNKYLNIQYKDLSKEIVSPSNFYELIIQCSEKFNDKSILYCKCFLENNENKELIDNHEKYFKFILNNKENYLNIIFKNENNIQQSFQIFEFLINQNKELKDEIENLRKKIKIYENKESTDKNADNNSYHIGLNCKFLNKNSEKIIDLKKIKKDIPIYHTFKIQNNGTEPFPADTILKCDNTLDSDIFFYPVNLGFCLMSFDDNNEIYYNVEVIINFKSYKNIQEKTYNIKAYLISDSKGRIGDENNFCTFQLIVKNYNNINEIINNH